MLPDLELLTDLSKISISAQVIQPVGTQLVNAQDKTTEEYVKQKQYLRDALESISGACTRVLGKI